MSAERERQKEIRMTLRIALLVITPLSIARDCGLKYLGERGGVQPGKVHCGIKWRNLEDL